MATTAPEIFSTIKSLSEERKQAVNNWVRETYDKANVAIWAAKADEDERDELNTLIKQAHKSDDWSHFTVEVAQGQASKPTNPEPVAQTVKEKPKVETSAEAETPIVDKVAGSTFNQQINQMINNEVERRVADYRSKVRAEVIAEIA